MSHAKHTLIKDIKKAITRLAWDDEVVFPDDPEFFDKKLVGCETIYGGLLYDAAYYIKEAIDNGEMESGVGSKPYFVDGLYEPDDHPEGDINTDAPEYFIFGMDDFMFAIEHAVQDAMENLQDEDNEDNPFNNMTTKKMRFAFDETGGELVIVRTEKVKNPDLKELLGRLHESLKNREAAKVRSSVMQVVDKALALIGADTLIPVIEALMTTAGKKPTPLDK